MKKIIVMMLTAHMVCAGPVLEMLKTKKNELMTQKNNIVNNKDQLVQVHRQLMNDLIGKIDVTVQKTIGTFIDSIVSAQNAIKDIPPVGLQFAGIGDIGIALSSLKEVLDTAKSILVNVRDRFNPIIASFDPSTDPKGIYAGLNSAVADMNKADQELITYIELVELLDL